MFVKCCKGFEAARSHTQKPCFPVNDKSKSSDTKEEDDKK